MLGSITTPTVYVSAISTSKFGLPPDNARTWPDVVLIIALPTKLGATPVAVQMAATSAATDVEPDGIPPAEQGSCAPGKFSPIGANNSPIYGARTARL